MTPKGRGLLTEKEVRAAIAGGKKALEIDPGTLVTPLAAEIAASAGIGIVTRDITVSRPDQAPSPRGPAQPPPGGDRTVAFGSDHGGFQLKGALIKHAESLGYRTIDLGTSSEEPCDYPDYAYAVARAVATGEAWRGVAIDGAGIGSCIVANKVPGVRAACCHNEFVARNSREHNDANVLTLGSRVVGSEVCKEILRIWLESWFAGGRHKGRVEKMNDIERRYLK
ncbi:MAG TPA: ribose 5-phosphate isomerase B [Bacteroidota bacterium]|nr:ribose 5-phosphate isomerase B [Bacteroidota bacterium]